MESGLVTYFSMTKKGLPGYLFFLPGLFVLSSVVFLGLKDYDNVTSMFTTLLGQYV